MILKRVKIHRIQNSYMIYVPVAWARNMRLENHEKMIWTIKEGEHQKLILQKDEEE